MKNNKFYAALMIAMALFSVNAAAQTVRYNTASVDWSSVGADGGIAQITWNLRSGDVAVAGMGSSFTTTLTMGDWDDAAMVWTTPTITGAELGYEGGPTNGTTTAPISWGALPTTPGYAFSATNILVSESNLTFGSGGETASVTQTGGAFPGFGNSATASYSHSGSENFGTSYRISFIPHGKFTLNGYLEMTPVPEPTSLLFVAFGSLGFLIRRKRS